MKTFLSLAAIAGSAQAAAVSTGGRPNPIRRVVTLLQEMSQEISSALETERNMHEKFACYCKKNDGELDAQAKQAAALIKKTKAQVESDAALKKQMSEEIKQHKKERSDAERKLKAAKEKRATEKAKYEEVTKDQRKTISDLDSAITALNKGMGKSDDKAFLQSSTAAMTAATNTLKRVLSSPADSQYLDYASQSTIEAFLQGGSSKDYASQSGEIVGILRMMKQNIDDSLGGVIQEEEGNAKAFKLLQSSLEQLIKTSTSSIEKKSEEKGAAAIRVVEGKNTISATEKSMGEAMATLAALKAACSDKAGEYAERQKDGNEEVQAIHQAISVLNNDDSLSLFRKTDTNAFLQLNQRVSLLQQKFTAQTKLSNNPVLLKKVFSNLMGDSKDNKAVALLSFTAKQALNQSLNAAVMSGQAVDFSKIFTMIDNMVSLLKTEASDDLASRDSCNTDLNENASEKVETEHSVAGHQADIESHSASIDKHSAAMQRSQDEIEAAKVSMSQASKQRTEENAEFIKATELNKEAIELIAKAKDKLNTFYNPQLVRKQTRVETDGEAATRASEALISVHNQAAGLPEGQPDMWEEGARKTQGQKGASVMSILQTISNDLQKDSDSLAHAEKTAERDYEQLSQDLAKQQVNSKKTLNQATSGKADAEGAKTTSESSLSMKEEEMADLTRTEQDLHAKCDFILQAFDERASARENEISGLIKAKAVLSGAQFGEE